MFLGIDQKDVMRIAAIGEMGDTLTYGDMVSFSRDWREKLPKRSLLFILCKNTIASLLGYVACLASGNVPLLLSADLDTELLRYLVETYQPNFLWIPTDRKEQICELAGVCCLPKEERGAEKDRAVLQNRDYCLIELNREAIEMYSELALLLTTSGSTGSPKLVRQTYRNIESNAAAIVQYLELDSTERPITTLPMNYTYGLSVINSHLLAGASILMTESTYAQRGFWDFFKKEQATSIAGVPYTYEILKKLRFFRMELPSLRYMTQAGGKLLPELHKEYAEYAKEHGKRFYVMYGQTEATARMSYLPYDRSLEKYGSMGIAIPGGAFSLIDVEGKKIQDAEMVGELVYEGPNVTPGYAQCQADLAKGDERNGTLVTGDMAKRDADGFYYIVGRKKRFLKIYGNRVNLDECERMLQGTFTDIEVACVGEDDHMRIYVTKQDMEKQIVDFISEKTGLHFKAFEVRYISEIPKNESGKKSYAGLGTIV